MQALGKSRELVHKLGFWKVFVIVFGLYIATNLLFLIPFLGVIIYLFLMLASRLREAILFIVIYPHIPGGVVTATLVMILL